MSKFKDFCTNTDLHATVILPGLCNARCKFCYDISENVENPNYKEDLRNALMKVPVETRKYAITGMETTLSPYLKDALELGEELKDHFDFRFLNTNGTKLLDYVELINRSLDAVNISRHSPDDEVNYDIFNTKTIPSKEQLKYVISKLKVPVNINMVILDSEFNESEKIYKMIDYCKDIGAKSLTIRFEAKDRLRKEPLPEWTNQYETIQHKANPGCHFWLKEINNFPVVLKYVTKEPTSYSDWNYGYIIQRDMRITRDWAGKKEWQL